MAMPWTPISRSEADLFTKDGYGESAGEQYKPWLDPERVWARRPVTALKGWTTGRVHYMTGELALLYFYVLEWSSMVSDIREHFPLHPIEETLGTAKALGIRHPVGGKRREPVVLVSDFLLTVQREGKSVQDARALVLSQDLEDRQLLQLLEIERCYWEARKIDWGIVTEHEIPLDMARNVALLHHHRTITDYVPESLVAAVCEELTQLVMTKQDQPLNHLTQVCDQRLHLDPGVSLAAAYCLLATRQWAIDMTIPIDPHRPLSIQSVALKTTNPSS